MNGPAPTRASVADRLRLADHAWGVTVPARYAEALVAVGEAVMTPGLTEQERLARIRIVIAAFAYVNTAREGESE